MKDKKISLKEIAKAIAWVIAFVLAWVGLNKWVEEIIEKKISSPAIIEKVKSQVRPIVIFDENESVLVDSGGMQYIEDIKIVHDDKKRLEEIIIIPKVHLPIAPILEPLDEEFAITSKRGRKFQWIYEMGSIDRLLLTSSAEHRDINRFRIEIIK
jgi:hypothetical protein